VILPSLLYAPIEVTSRVIYDEATVISSESRMPARITLGLLTLAIGVLSLHIHPAPKILGGSLRASRPVHGELVFTESPMPLQVRSEELNQLIDEYNKHACAGEYNTRFKDVKLRLVKCEPSITRVGNGETIPRTDYEKARFGTMFLGQLYDGPRFVGEFYPGINKSEINWWETRLTNAFRIDFEKERERADVQFEQWRREALKLKKHEDFNHWHDVLDTTPFPSDVMRQIRYSPEPPRGKFKVVDKTTRQFAYPGNWFDHVFEGPKIKEKPNKRAMEKFVSTLPKKDQVKYAPLIGALYGDEGTNTAIAREKGIKMKSQDKAVQRLMKKFEKYQQNGGHLYDPTKLSMRDIDRILNFGGIYVVLPPKRDGLALELIPVESETNPARLGLLDGLSGNSSDDIILSEVEMQAKRDARDAIDAKKLPRGRRNRDVQAAFASITKRFTLAEVIHFSDPEQVQERIAEQVSLNKDEESL
jgi:hypothetical protein